MIQWSLWISLYIFEQIFFPWVPSCSKPLTDKNDYHVGFARDNEHFINEKMCIRVIVSVTSSINELFSVRCSFNILKFIRCITWLPSAPCHYIQENNNNIYTAYLIATIIQMSNNSETSIAIHCQPMCGGLIKVCRRHSSPLLKLELDGCCKKSRTKIPLH